MPRAFALIFALACLSLLPRAQASGEMLKSETGFYVDMPAGFTLIDGDGKTRFAFQDPNGGMEFDIRIYDSGRYADSAAMAQDVATKLKSEGEVEGFGYEGRKATMAELRFLLNGQSMRGYGMFLGGAKTEKSFALLAYCAEPKFEAYADFILSCLDAFSFDRAALRDPGPISQYLLAWPPERKGAKQVRLPGDITVGLPWSPEEAQAETDTAGREYRVLTTYAQSDTLWLDAWSRFYRMVYRESAARLDRLAVEISRGLPQADPTESARRVLAWVQGFVYERDTKGIDFVTPLVGAYEGRGDCDSRAVVMAAILERLGIDCVLMISREYSHAMLAVDVPGGGQRFPWRGKQYLVAETPAKVGLGMIAQTQTDWSKWLGVDLGQ
ncbi:MAG TPA: transglutaminase-like domain-containing protein [Rectinemataceae bacterium]|nr:transglutaminase-like domain-containing protein [Rectinemataceae bacterium]